MRISFRPQFNDRALIATKAGDALTLNGESFDFTSLPDGASIPVGFVPCEWIASSVERIGGDLHLTLFLPCNIDPERVMPPADIIDPPDGSIALPVAEEI